MTNGTPLCAGCGKPMPGSRLAQGQARCQPCRRLVHGRVARYKQGCRCDECRAANAAAMSAYYRSKVDSGERSPWAGRSADSRRRHALSCEHCGSDFRSEDRQQRFCSVRCHARNRSGRSPSQELVHVGPLPRPSAPAPTTTVVTSPRFWSVLVAGPCAWCGMNFVGFGRLARYCSDRCRSRLQEASRGHFQIRPADRLAIYERDGWVCQLCMEPVEADADPTSDWFPSLDHIEPQSLALIPDHSPANLRTAHRWCNAVRGAHGLHDDLFEGLVA